VERRGEGGERWSGRVVVVEGDWVEPLRSREEAQRGARGGEEGQGAWAGRRGEERG